MFTVPFPATLAIVLGICPMIHFQLLKISHLSNSIIASIGAILLIVTPLLFPSPSKLINDCIKGASFFFVLRVLEIATFSRSMNLKWTLFDYCQFLATSDNVPTLAEAERKAQQALKDGTKRKERKWTPKIVKAEERDGAFYLSVVIGLVAHYLFYGFALAYCRKYEYNTPTGFLSLFDWKGVLDHVMFFILFYCDIWISYVLATLGMVMALGAPYTPIFDQPYLATSLRDFWSHRWNYPIKLTFHRLVFTPLLSLFESYNKATSPNTSKHRHTELQLVTATFASFCFSAMFHEYILVLLMPDEKAGVQFTFFIINGVLCIAQIWLQRMTGFGISWGFGRGWKVVGWALTAATLLTTAPLFVGSYARTGTMMQLPVPDRVVSFWQMLI